MALTSVLGIWVPALRDTLTKIAELSQKQCSVPHQDTKLRAIELAVVPHAQDPRGGRQSQLETASNQQRL